MEQFDLTYIQTLIICVVCLITGMVIPFAFPKKTGLRSEDILPDVPDYAPLHLQHSVEKLNLQMQVNYLKKREESLTEENKEMERKLDLYRKVRPIASNSTVSEATREALEYGKRVHEELANGDKIKLHFGIDYGIPDRNGTVFMKGCFDDYFKKQNMKTEPLVKHLQSIGATDVNIEASTSFKGKRVSFRFNDANADQLLPRMVEVRDADNLSWTKAKLIYTCSKGTYSYVVMQTHQDGEEYVNRYNQMREIPKHELPTKTCWLDEPFEVRVSDIGVVWVVKKLLGYNSALSHPYITEHIEEVQSYKLCKLID